MKKLATLLNNYCLDTHKNNKLYSRSLILKYLTETKTVAIFEDSLSVFSVALKLQKKYRKKFKKKVSINPAPLNVKSFIFKNRFVKTWAFNTNIPFFSNGSKNLLCSLNKALFSLSCLKKKIIDKGSFLLLKPHKAGFRCLSYGVLSFIYRNKFSKYVCLFKEDIRIKHKTLKSYISEITFSNVIYRQVFEHVKVILFPKTQRKRFVKRFTKKNSSKIRITLS